MLLSALVLAHGLRRLLPPRVELLLMRRLVLRLALCELSRRLLRSLSGLRVAVRLRELLPIRLLRLQRLGQLLTELLAPLQGLLLQRILVLRRRLLLLVHLLHLPTLLLVLLLQLLLLLRLDELLLLLVVVHLEVLQQVVLLQQLRRHLRLHLPLHVLLKELLLLHLLHRLSVGLRRRRLQVAVQAVVELAREGARLHRLGVRPFQAKVAEVVAQVGPSEIDATAGARLTLTGRGGGGMGQRAGEGLRQAALCGRENAAAWGYRAPTCALLAFEP